MTVAETGELLTVLQTVWQKQLIDERVILTYQAVLADVSLADGLAAAHAWMRKGEWFPVPAQLLALVPKAIEPLALPEPPGEVERPKLLYRLLDEETGDFIELDPPRVLTPELAAERRRYWFGEAR